MIEQVRFMSACLAEEETPETVIQPRLWHEVSGMHPKGHLVRLKVHATDPMEAINLARYRKIEDWKPAEE